MQTVNLSETLRQELLTWFLNIPESPVYSLVSVLPFEVVAG